MTLIGHNLRGPCGKQRGAGLVGATQQPPTRQQFFHDVEFRAEIVGPTLMMSFLEHSVEGIDSTLPFFPPAPTSGAAPPTPLARMSPDDPGDVMTFDQSMSLTCSASLTLRL